MNMIDIKKAAAAWLTCVFIIIAFYAGALGSSALTQLSAEGDAAQVGVSFAEENGEHIAILTLTNDPGLMGFKLGFEYDPNQVDILCAKRGSVTDSGNFIDNIGINEGCFDILWNDTQQTENDGSIAKIYFEPLTDRFTVTVSCSGPDTFNESMEDVELICGDIVYDKTGTEQTDESLQNAPATVRDITKKVIDENGFADTGALSGRGSKELLRMVNEQARELLGIDHDVYSSEEELLGELEAYAAEELLSGAVESGADTAVENYLESKGESLVTKENAAAVRGVIADTGANIDAGRCLDDEAFAGIVNRIYLGKTEEVKSEKNAIPFGIIITAVCAAVILALLTAVIVKHHGN